MFAINRQAVLDVCVFCAHVLGPERVSKTANKLMVSGKLGQMYTVYIYPRVPILGLVCLQLNCLGVFMFTCIALPERP